LLSAYKQKISDYRLVPASGGCFELTVNGELLYSKTQTGRFPDEAAMLEAVGKRLR
jgi:selenoprotein W-related protein